MEHELKCWPGSFAAHLSGLKSFEVRLADRPYDTGDDLILKEWIPAEHLAGEYTGRVLRRRVISVYRGVGSDPVWLGGCRRNELPTNVPVVVMGLAEEVIVKRSPSSEVVGATA